jgi:hypothetical protein
MFYTVVVKVGHPPATQNYENQNGTWNGSQYGTFVGNKFNASTPKVSRQTWNFTATNAEAGPGRMLGLSYGLPCFARCAGSSDIAFRHRRWRPPILQQWLILVRIRASPRFTKADMAEDIARSGRL